MSDTSSRSSSPEEVVRVKSRIRAGPKKSREGWGEEVKKKLDELDANQVGIKSTGVAWGAEGEEKAGRQGASTANLSISSLKQLRQELEDAKMERRNLLKAAQKVLKNPLKIEVPHRLDASSARKEVANQRRKALKEVVDALSVALVTSPGEENKRMFDYDIEIQAVVSFVQDKFHEIMASAVDDLKAKARTHKHRALAKAEENATLRMRNVERASRQEQAALSQDLFKAKRQVDALKKKLSNAQLDAGRRERELKNRVEELSANEKKMQDKVAKALERAQKAEKRAMESSNFMATQIEEIQKQTGISISEHKHKTESLAQQLEHQTRKATEMTKNYEALYSATEAGQADLKSQIEEAEALLSPCEALLEDQEAYMRALRDEATEAREETLATFKGFVKDISEACAVSETVLKTWSQYWQHMNHSGNWVSRKKYDKESAALTKAWEDQEKRIEGLQSELSGFQKVVARAQTDKAIADTKVRRLAETASELRQKMEEDERDAKALLSKAETAQSDLAAAKSDLAGKSEQIATKSAELEKVVSECASLKEEVVARRREAWRESSSSLTDIGNRVNLLVSREPLSLSGEAWLEILATIDQTKGAQDQEGAQGGGEKENFLAAASCLESGFVHALKTVCLSVAKEHTKRSRTDGAPTPPQSPARKPRPRAIIPKLQAVSKLLSPTRSTKTKTPSRVLSPTRATRTKTPSRGTRASPSKQRARQGGADVQTVISVIKKARELSCFDARMSMTAARSARKEGTGIKSLTTKPITPYSSNN